MWADREGYVDTTGAVWAYAGAAKKRGATVIEHNRVLELKQRPDSSWDLITEAGVINAEHVVNAAGLWAKQVGRMVGLDLPLSPLEHHYLLTETIPEIAGLRQNCRWSWTSRGSPTCARIRRGCWSASTRPIPSTGRWTARHGITALNSCRRTSTASPASSNSFTAAIRFCRRRGYANGSTARSPSRLTATRSLARSPASRAIGSPAASWLDFSRAAASASRWRN